MKTNVPVKAMSVTILYPQGEPYSYSVNDVIVFSHEDEETMEEIIIDQGRQIDTIWLYPTTSNRFAIEVMNKVGVVLMYISDSVPVTIDFLKQTDFDRIEDERKKRGD